jgi:hypothetical protein
MTILSTIMGVETGGGRNITQGNIGDINNRTGDLAQGYYQITGGTWRDFGGASTGYGSAIQAPYGTQLQVAQNIPVQRWGPRTQAELGAAGYHALPGETLGSMLSRYGENPAATQPIDGASVAPGMLAQGPADYSVGSASGAVFVGEGDHSAGAGAGVGGIAGDAAKKLNPASAGLGMPLAIGIQASLAQGITQWIDGIAKGVWEGTWKSISATFLNLQNWFIRAFLIIVGIVILAIGLFKVSGHDFSELTVMLPGGRLAAAA